MAMMLAFEKLVYEMRLDLEHKNEDLRQGQLLGLFLTDPDTIKSS